MLFCERDCAAYSILKEEGTCDDTIAFVRSFADTTMNFDFVRVIGIFEKVDCSNTSTYYFFESDNYAEACTGLVSEQYVGQSILIETLCSLV